MDTIIIVTVTVIISYRMLHVDSVTVRYNS
jgi:hypothetical protein